MNINFMNFIIWTLNAHFGSQWEIIADTHLLSLIEHYEIDFSGPRICYSLQMRNMSRIKPITWNYLKKKLQRCRLFVFFHIFLDCAIDFCYVLAIPSPDDGTRFLIIERRGTCLIQSVMQ